MQCEHSPLSSRLTRRNADTGYSGKLWRNLQNAALRRKGASGRRNVSADLRLSRHYIEARKRLQDFFSFAK